MEIKFNVNGNKKQLECAKYWVDKTTEEIVYGGGKGGGKIVADYSNVLTPFGFKKGIDLNVGMLINNHDGSVQKIIQIKPYVELEKWSVYFSDGTHTDVAKDHLWTSWKSNKTRKIKNKEVSGYKSAEVVETQEIKNWLKRGFKPQIPICEEQPFNFTSKERNRIKPYLLGVLLGDGCFTKNNLLITSHKDDINHYIKNIPKLEYSTNNKDSIYILGEDKKHIKEKLSNYKLDGLYSHEKFIPKQYKYGSIKDRYSIIQGLLDTDGYNPKEKNGCYYCTTSKIMAEDVQFILRSLGCYVKIRKGVGKYKKDGKVVICRDYYELYIKSRKSDNLFRLSRKKDNRAKINISKRIVDIKVSGKVKGRCITVSNPNGLYITDDFIVTHNSFLGVNLIFGDAFIYPDTRYFIARKTLADLVKHTTPSIYEVFAIWGITENMYRFDGKNNVWHLHNGSKVFFLDAKYLPSDPTYARFGSMQMTRGWIEEAGEFEDERCVTSLANSLERWNNEKYNLAPKLLQTCNPAKNYLYEEYYVPYRDKELPLHRKFIQALVGENKKLPKGYADKMIRRMENDPSAIQRLVYGNWEYDDNELAIFDYDKILGLFTNSYIEKTGFRYLTADIAYEGSDLFVIGIWDGFILEKVIAIEKISEVLVSSKIHDLRMHYGIPISNVIYDADGLKTFVKHSTKEGNLKGAIAFNNNRRAFSAENYRNLKAQCYFKLAEMTAKGQIYISDFNYKKEIVKELEQICRAPSLDDGKISLEKKADLKKRLGKSPDFADMMMMRMFTEVKTFKDIKVKWC